MQKSRLQSDELKAAEEGEAASCDAAGSMSKTELLKNWPIRAKDMTELAWAYSELIPKGYKSGYLKTGNKFDILISVSCG